MTEPLKVVPKSNPEPGMRPLPAELVTGELAVNTSDAVLYTKLADGSIAPVCCGGVAPTVLNGGYFTGRPCGGGGGGGGGGGAARFVTSVTLGQCGGCDIWVAWFFQAFRPVSSSAPLFRIQYSTDPIAIAGYGEQAEWSDPEAAFSSESLVPTAWTLEPTPRNVADWDAFASASTPEFFGGQGSAGFRLPLPKPAKIAVRVLAILDGCETADCAGDQLWADYVIDTAACDGCDLNWGCAIEGGCIRADCTPGPNCFATQAECEAANCGGDPLSYHCVDGSCQSALVEPDYVTYFPTVLECQSRCDASCGRTHTATCINGGTGYRWDPVNQPGEPCQFATAPAGWDGSTPIYGPTPYGHSTGPNGEIYSSCNDGYGRWWPLEYCGPCNAENEGASCTIACTVYNPAP